MVTGEKKGKGRGRPRITLTEEIKLQLENMYAKGLAIPHLCAVAGICEHTLRREMEGRLNRAKALFLERVADTAGKRALAGSERMIELIMHTQAGWTKSEKMDITSGGEPLSIVVQRRTLRVIDADNDV